MSQQPREDLSRVNLELQKKIHADLKIQAIREGKTLHDLVHEIFNAGLQLHKKQAA